MEESRRLAVLLRDFSTSSSPTAVGEEFARNDRKCVGPTIIVFSLISTNRHHLPRSWQMMSDDKNQLGDGTISITV